MKLQLVELVFHRAYFVKYFTFKKKKKVLKKYSNVSVILYSINVYLFKIKKKKLEKILLVNIGRYIAHVHNSLVHDSPTEKPINRKINDMFLYTYTKENYTTVELK